MNPEREKTPLRRWIDRLLMIGFMIALFLPLLDSWLGLDRSGELTEMRNLAELEAPMDAVDLIEEFPAHFEQFYQDQFGFRRTLIRLHGQMMLNLLQVSPVPDVRIGEQGWIYYADASTLKDMRGEVRYTPKELETWRKYLEGRKAWFNERGIAYVFTIAPNKASIYPEFLPDSIRKMRRPTRLDQLTEYLRENSSVQVLDLRQPLLEAKPEMPLLFYKTDTHWNDLGAYVAYRAIMEELARQDPSLSAVPWEGFEIIPDAGPYEGDLLRMLVDAGEHLVERNMIVTVEDERLRALTDPSNADQKLVEDLLAAETQLRRPPGFFFGDSFFTALNSFFLLHFDVMRRDWDRQEILEELPNWPEENLPKVVVEERSERYARTPDLSPMFEEARLRAEGDQTFLNSEVGGAGRISPGKARISRRFK